MNTDEQNKLWASMPKEERNDIIISYRDEDDDWSRGWDAAMKRIFGHHNLVSSMEVEKAPDEKSSICDTCANESYGYCRMYLRNNGILMPTYHRESCDDYNPKSQYEIVEEGADNKIDTIKDNSNSSNYRFGESSRLFDEDSCIPTPMNEQKPKYEIGQTVLCKAHDVDIESICTIIAFNPKAKEYTLLCGNSEIIYRKEDDIKPYIEGKKQMFNVGDKVIHNHKNREVGKVVLVDVDEKNFCYCVRFGHTYYNMAEHQLLPYTEEKNPDLNKLDKMLDDALEKETPESLNDWISEHKKELNIRELIKKDYKDTEFYSPIYGRVTIKFSDNESIMEMWPLSKDAYLPLASNGHHADHPNNGNVIIYPSKELYEKYPLNAANAWTEWYEKREHKRWRAEYGETYYSLKNDFSVCDQIENADSYDDKAWDRYNYFRTESDAEEAAKVVRNALEEFHKKNSYNSKK